MSSSGNSPSHSRARASSSPHPRPAPIFAHSIGLDQPEDASSPSGGLEMQSTGPSPFAAATTSFAPAASGGTVPGAEAGAAATGSTPGARRGQTGEIDPVLLAWLGPGAGAHASAPPASATGKTTGKTAVGTRASLSFTRPDAARLDATDASDSPALGPMSGGAVGRGSSIGLLMNAPRGSSSSSSSSSSSGSGGGIVPSSSAYGSYTSPGALGPSSSSSFALGGAPGAGAPRLHATSAVPASSATSAAATRETASPSTKAPSPSTGAAGAEAGGIDGGAIAVIGDPATSVLWIRRVPLTGSLGSTHLLPLQSSLPSSSTGVTGGTGGTGAAGAGAGAGAGLDVMRSPSTVGRTSVISTASSAASSSSDAAAVPLPRTSSSSSSTSSGSNSTNSNDNGLRLPHSSSHDGVPAPGTVLPPDPSVASETLPAAASRLLRQQYASLLYIGGEVRRQPKGYALGWFIVFIVVVFIAILINAVVQSPLIFYRLSEVQAGESDLIAYPGAGIREKVVEFPQPVPLLDLPLYSTALPTIPSPEAAPGVAGVAGRWLLLGQIKRNATSGPSPLESANAIVLGIDTEQEKRLGLGRTWTLPPVPEGSTYLSRSIVTQLQLDKDAVVGTQLVLAVDPAKLLAQFGILPPASAEAGEGGEDLDDDDAKKFLLRVAPQVDWETVYTTPLFTGEPTNFTASTIIDVEAFGEVVIAQLKQIPITEAGLMLIDQFTVRLSFRDLNGFLSTAAPPPYTVTYPNGASIKLVRPLPPPFPDDVDHPVELVFSKIPGTEDWEVDKDGFDASVRSALELSGPSESTVGNYVTFFLPVLFGATRVVEELTVAHVLGSPDGKFAENVGAVAIMESKTLVSLLTETLLSAISGSFTIAASPGTIDVAVFVNNAGIIGPDLTPITIPPTPVPVPTVTLTTSFPELALLAGAQPDDVDAFVAAAEAFARSLTADAYAPTVTVQMTDRKATYLQSENSLDRSMLAFTDTVALRVGVDYPARVVLPLLEVLRGTLAIRYFLDNIFNAVIALVAALGALLVFSLLLNDVETKTYEYGMLRALGMRKSNLVQILLSKGFLFSVLGIGTGLFIAFLVSIPITDLLTNFAEVTPDYRMNRTAAIVATCVGLLMPALANIVPISRALSKTLRDSLDVYHHVVSDVTVTMVRLADLGLDMWQTAIALLLIAIGFITFYLIPLSFINNNIPMFLGLLMSILIAMLLGLALLAQIVQPFLERGLLFLLMLPFHSNLTALVRKSLSAHRPRNSKTAQMFTISLAFVVFAGVMFALQATSLADNLRIFIGAPLVVQAPNLAEALKEDAMLPYLNAQVKLTEEGAPNGILKAYSFVSFRATSTGVARYSRFNNLAENPQQRQRIYGIQRSFYDSIYNGYYQDVETNTGNDPAVVGLFTDAGNARLPIEDGHGERWVPESISTSLNRLRVTDIHTDDLDEAIERRKKELNETYSDYVDAVCSEGLRNVISIDTKTAASIRFLSTTRSSRSDSFHRTYFTKVRGMVKHVPGFFFSSYPTIVSRGSALVREDQLLRMLNDVTPNAPFATVPKERLMLNVLPSATSRQRDDLVAGLRGYFSSDDVTVTDTERLVESTSFALDMLNVFFVIVGVLSMVLCFVILWLSFTANVQENAWEFGVLRAVGLNTKQVVMTYIYEALALILACVILGTVIGIAIAVSLTLQFNLFTEVAFKMEFPFLLYFLLFGMAIVVAIVASAVPAYAFIQHSVAETLRRT